MTSLMDKGREVDIVFMDFSKAFATASHKILRDKLMKYGLQEQAGRWIQN